MPQDPVPVPDSGPDPAARRWPRLQHAIDACIDRRLQGETLSDGDIIAAHPDLMPELESELRNLAVIEAARRRASKADDPAQQDVTAATARGVGTDPLAQDFPGYEVLCEMRRRGPTMTCHAIHDASDREVVLRLFGDISKSRIDAFEHVIHDLTALNKGRIAVPHAWGLTAAGAFFTVTDFVVGDSLVERLRRDLTCGDAGRALEVLAAAADLVHILHRRDLTHGRLPRHNILVDRDGHPHVIDCGIAVLHGDDLTDGHAQDVAGLGAALRDALAGASSQSAGGSVFGGASRQAEINAIIQKSVHDDPQSRYNTAGDLAADLRRWLAGEHVDACCDRPGYTLSKSLRRGIQRILKRPF